MQMITQPANRVATGSVTELAALNRNSNPENLPNKRKSNNPGFKTGHRGDHRVWRGVERPRRRERAFSGSHPARFDPWSQCQNNLAGSGIGPRLRCYRRGKLLRAPPVMPAQHNPRFRSP